MKVNPVFCSFQNGNYEEEYRKMLLENAQELKEMNNALNERFRAHSLGFLGQNNKADDDSDDDDDDGDDERHHVEEEEEEEAEYDEQSHFDGESKLPLTD